MVYSKLYESGDMSAVIIDLIVGIFAAAVSFVTLIGMVILYKFVRRNM